MGCSSLQVLGEAAVTVQILSTGGARFGERPLLEEQSFLGFRADLQPLARAGLPPQRSLDPAARFYAGVPCIGLNGGPAFKHNEAFSFQIATDDQQETDQYWNAIVGNGGEESQCGWCKDKWGVSWQITPRVLTEALAAGGDEAKRAFDAMMGMTKIDVSAIEAARRG